MGQVIDDILDLALLQVKGRHHPMTVFHRVRDQPVHVLVLPELGTGKIRRFGTERSSSRAITLPIRTVTNFAIILVYFLALIILVRRAAQDWNQQHSHEKYGQSKNRSSIHETNLLPCPVQAQARPQQPKTTPELFLVCLR
jgi:hypothetical protein